MKVVVDKNLDLSAVRFPQDWELNSIDGREITATDVKDADALIVRSITPVDQQLLDGSKVKFVGSATSGLDHVDQRYLNQEGIQLADAAGSNANAVCDYVCAALAYLVVHQGFELDGKTIGVVGAGNVGARLLARLSRLALNVLVCDPFIERGQNDGSQPYAGRLSFCTLEDVAKADLISLHVPLTDHAEHPTRSMIGSEFLESMPESSVLINTCRGEVVDETVLLNHIKSNEGFISIQDVWCNEPMVNPELIASCNLATPHIAGYSAIAKSTAASSVANALLRARGVESDSEPLPESIDFASISAENINLNNAEAWQLVADSFPLLDLSRRFRRNFVAGSEKETFDTMRKELAHRKEFGEMELTPAVDKSTSRLLRALGFSRSGLDC